MSVLVAPPCPRTARKGTQSLPAASVQPARQCLGHGVICPGSVHIQQPLPRLDSWRQCTAGLALEDPRGGWVGSLGPGVWGGPEGRSCPLLQGSCRDEHVGLTDVQDAANTTWKFCLRQRNGTYTTPQLPAGDEKWPRRSECLAQGREKPAGSNKG